MRMIKSNINKFTAVFLREINVQFSRKEFDQMSNTQIYTKTN